jgi:hypothetical protein
MAVARTATFFWKLKIPSRSGDDDPVAVDEQTMARMP